MNILVVDDNRNNRMILKLLLQDYMESADIVDFSIQEANDGLEAVAKAKNSQFDIIFMDIMMPNMNGIEATRIIKEMDSRVMIIAVSAIEELEKKDLILNNGAEDYISKPIDSHIFISRISNYIMLCQSRKNKSSFANGANVFTKEIYSRYTVFVINSEDALSEFWEFFLMKILVKPNGLSDIVRAIFNLVDFKLRVSMQSKIYIEESDEFQYFTLTDIDKIPTKMLESTLAKNAIISDYKISGKRISFRLKKREAAQMEEPPKVSKQIEPFEPKDEPKNQEIPKEQTPINSYVSQKLEVFNYMDDEDLYGLEEYAGKLNSLMLIVGSGDIGESDILDLCSYLEKLGNILSTYTEVYAISVSLSQLAYDMRLYINEFMKYSEALGPICRAFSVDMSNWIEKSFHTGAPSVDFMNDTIVVNCQTISNMLKIDDAHSDVEYDFVDDIFDF